MDDASGRRTLPICPCVSFFPPHLDARTKNVLHCLTIVERKEKKAACFFFFLDKRAIASVFQKVASKNGMAVRFCSVPLRQEGIVLGGIANEFGSSDPANPHPRDCHYSGHVTVDFQLSTPGVGIG